MTVDDFVDVVRIDIRVPDAIGVDDDAWSLLTAVEAAGFVDANFSLAVQVELLDARFGVFLHFRSVMVRATRRAIFALIQAEENVTLVVAHAQIIRMRAKRAPRRSAITRSQARKPAHRAKAVTASALVH